jgi:hypothetical protein
MNTISQKDLIKNRLSKDFLEKIIQNLLFSESSKDLSKENFEVPRIKRYTFSL